MLSSALAAFAVLLALLGPAQAGHRRYNTPHKPLGAHRLVLPRAGYPAPAAPQTRPTASLGADAFAPSRYQPLHPALVVTVREPRRAYRYTGTITLADPDTGDVLGHYTFATGGAGRGSAPFGDYEVGAFRDDGPIGPRWMLREVGRDDGDVWDPKLRDMRTAIELHMAHGAPGFSLGCVAVLGGPAVWREFMARLFGLLDRLGGVAFVVGKPEEPAAVLSAY